MLNIKGASRKQKLRRILLALQVHLRISSILIDCKFELRRDGKTQNFEVKCFHLFYKTFATIRSRLVWLSLSIIILAEISIGTFESYKQYKEYSIALSLNGRAQSVDQASLKSISLEHASQTSPQIPFPAITFINEFHSEPMMRLTYLFHYQMEALQKFDIRGAFWVQAQEDKLFKTLM